MQFPGDFDYQKYLEWKDVYSIVKCNQFSRIDLLESYQRSISLKSLMSNIRRQLIDQIEKNFSNSSSFLIQGLLTGDRTEIPKEITENFVNSGVVHVLAVSGLHTGFVLIILIGLVGRFKKYIQLIIVSLGLLFFIYLTGNSPSVVRASIMAVCWMIAKTFERQSNILNTLAIAGLIILIIDPRDLFNPSFQLSFGAVLSIALIYPNFKVVREKLTKIVKENKFALNAVDIFIISIAVQIGTFPFVVGYFEKFSIIAIIANILVIPLIGIVLGASIASIIILNVLPFLFSVYKATTEFLIQITLWIVNYFGKLPMAFIPIENFSFLNSFLYFIALVIVLLIVKSKYNFRTKSILIVLILSNYFIYFPLYQKEYLPDKLLTTTYINTGNVKSIGFYTKGMRFTLLNVYSDDLDSLRLDRQLQKQFKILGRLGFSKSRIILIQSVPHNFHSYVLTSAVKNIPNKKFIFRRVNSILFSTDTLKQRALWSIVDGDSYTFYSKVFSQSIGERQNFDVFDMDHSTVILANGHNSNFQKLKSLKKDLIFFHFNAEMDTIEYIHNHTSTIKALGDKLDSIEVGKNEKYFGTKIYAFEDSLIKEVNWKEIR